MSIKPHAFPVANRLTEKGSFTEVFAKPVYTKKTAAYSVFASLSSQPQARLGMVVAKRNVKLAVARNKIKRLVRESFRQQQQRLKGLDIVVVIKKNFILDQSDAVNLPGIFKVVGDKHVAKTSNSLHQNLPSNLKQPVLGQL